MPPEAGLWRLGAEGLADAGESTWIHCAIPVYRGVSFRQQAQRHGQQFYKQKAGEEPEEEEEDWEQEDTVAKACMTPHCPTVRAATTQIPQATAAQWRRAEERRDWRVVDDNLPFQSGSLFSVSAPD